MVLQKLIEIASFSSLFSPSDSAAVDLKVYFTISAIAMKSLSIFFFFFLTAICITSSATTSAPVPAAISKTVVVDQQGKGDFTSVQAAINSVPPNNNKWFKIHIKNGIYKEKVDIPQDKGFIILEGEGSKTTSIESAGHMMTGAELNSIPSFSSQIEPPSATLETSATFSVIAGNIVVKNIGFKNYYYEQKAPVRQALAGYLFGDKISFYNCSFSGFQDTLCDMYGRHYFNNCFIEGAVDFIFGMGQSIYESCTISSSCGGMTGPGWLTAHGRVSPNDTTGFVFKFCNVTGSGEAYLGRAWGPYSRVVFYKSYMSSIVVPRGWDPWHYAGKEANLVYAESGCDGPGSNTTDRVRWANQLGEKDVEMLSSIKYIDDEGWLQQQPYQY